MKKKTIITILAVIALILSLSLDNKAYVPPDCAGCKADGYCDKHDPQQGWACTYGGSGSDCNFYYGC